MSTNLTTDSLTSQKLVADTEEAAMQALHAAGCTDGLPVVIPTDARVARMILASGLDGDIRLGDVGPNQGVASIEKVAIAAVMAGCLPDYFPVVVAAVQTLCDPRFDATEVQSTTHGVSPLVIVNGPIRTAAGLASGFGAMGPGHRANATIGRALRLVMQNVGGAQPGVSDMALLGHAGKFTACLAEDEEHSPFPPLHTSLGFAADQSTVTLVGVEAAHSVMSVGDADDPTSADRLLASLAATIANVGSNNAFFGKGSVVVVLNPDHAAALAAAGHTRQSIQDQLHERAANPLGLLRSLNPTFTPRSGADDDRRRATASPTDILVMQAGGGGLYSHVFPSWGTGPHGNTWVVAEVLTDQACALPIR